ncbi:DUF4351 domain-containing protein [Synechocystis sp. PCC 7339]|uniref:DUF4351 domain-containing protein n=1 Tax=Synechocystis sp. PCC 7339 TaxID=2782213 RepID=UPI001CC13975|nr:DUF4351 domain-containing protein [Synechocystis sp. PCC 7339]
MPNLRQALLSLRTDPVLTDLEPLLSFFASFVLDIPLVQQIMRWDMTVLRESPWYNEILKEGLERGNELGLQQGRQEGEANVLICLLKRQLGELTASQEQRVKRLSIARLEELGEVLLDFTGPADLEQFLADLEG